MTNRTYSLDVIRAFAILFVVANHAIELIFPFGAIQYQSMSFAYQIFQFIVFTTGRLGVPLFLMLTGYLLVPRDYSTKEKILNFYKRNFIGLILVWYIWIILYNLFFLFFEHKQFVLSDVISEFLFVHNVPLMHTWYMKEIIIIYSILPVLSIVIKRLKSIPIVIVIILVIAIINNLFGGIRYLRFLSNQLMYIAYVCTGYYFAVSKSYLNRFWNLSIFIFGFCSIVTWQIYTYHGPNPTTVWYTNVLLYLTSLPLFSLLLVNRWRKGQLAQYVIFLSIISFGIYLLHVPVMKIILSVFPSINNIGAINVFLLFVLSITASAVIIYPITKIPLAARILFYIKGMDKSK